MTQEQMRGASGFQAALDHLTQRTGRRSGSTRRPAPLWAVASQIAVALAAAAVGYLADLSVSMGLLVLVGGQLVVLVIVRVVTGPQHYPRAAQRGLGLLSVPGVLVLFNVVDGRALVAGLAAWLAALLAISTVVERRTYCRSHS